MLFVLTCIVIQSDWFWTSLASSAKANAILLYDTIQLTVICYSTLSVTVWPTEWQLLEYVWVKARLLHYVHHSWHIAVPIQSPLRWVYSHKQGTCCGPHALLRLTPAMIIICLVRWLHYKSTTKAINFVPNKSCHNCRYSITFPCKQLSLTCENRNPILYIWHFYLQWQPHLQHN